MAVAVMRTLTDPKARTEVRAEAARALGLMQITTVVPDGNFPLVAYAAAQLAAHVGDQIVASYSADKGTPLERIEGGIPDRTPGRPGLSGIRGTGGSQGERTLAWQRDRRAE